MKLIQQTPAWSMHAYIRILGLEYSTENTMAFKALGLQLPILVDEVQTKTEMLAMNYLSKRYGNISTDMSMETVFAAYLRQSLMLPFQQLKRIHKSEEKELFRVLPIGLNFAVNFMGDVREFFCGDRFDAIPGATEQELLDYVTRIYGELNDSILDRLAKGGVPTFAQCYDPEAFMEDEAETLFNGATTPPSASISAERRRRMRVGVAEAIMFGHMAEVLSTHEHLASILTRHDGLLSFFQYISTTFFTVPYAEACANGRDHMQWKASMDAILNNKFLTGTTQSERVKQCLLHGHAIPSTRVSDGMLSSVSVSMRTYSTIDGDYDNNDLYPRRDSVLNDTNPLSLHESKLSSPQQLPSSQSSSLQQSPQKYYMTSNENDNEQEEVCSLDPYLVKDEPTKFQNISFDYSISTEWKRAYDHVSQVFNGFNRNSISNTTMENEKLATALSVTSGTTSIGSSKVTLSGMMLLFSVTTCFAGYAYYSTKKMKR